MRYSLLSDKKNWMSAVDDGTSLAHISIPGTHDSCARIHASKQIPLVDEQIATQNSNCSISKQLSDGIRYLDIRCCAIDGVFAIHHGVFYLNINFGTVLEECISFLKENPTEIIIMRIQQENSSVSDREFLEIFNTKYACYHPYMYLKSTIPDIGEVRGKIVILSNVLSVPGISYRKIAVQDNYSPGSLLEKVSNVKEFINKSVSLNKDNAVLHLNHFSATIIPGTPRSFSNVFNPRITEELKKGLGADLVDSSKNEAPHIGIAAMDFYTDTLVAEIIKRNDNKFFKNLPVYSIYNEFYGKHYFYASAYMDSATDRRRVFGWSAGGKVREGYWLLIPYGKESEKYYIFNTYYKEFLYASSFIEDSRRDVFTWVEGVPTRESVWTLKNDYIYNEYYKCYLYESSLSFLENRKLVPCWAPGNRVSQSHWKMVLEHKTRSPLLR